MITSKVKKIAALMLAMVIMLSLVACSSSEGKSVMTLGDESISINMYRFWLSRVKGTYGGSDSSVWDEKDEGGKTYNELFTDYVIENTKTFLCSLYLFDEMKLSLPKDKKAKVEKTMKTILKENADGSKSVLNAQLAPYGVNYNILKDIYMIEAKLAYLQESLYGENGTEKLSDEIKQEYYEDNYVRIKQIFLYTANKPVLDKDGKYTYDENGNVVTRDYTDDEIAVQKQKANAALEKLNSGADFDAVIAEFSEDTASSEYPNGYYFTITSQYVGEVVSTAFELEDDEYTLVNSDYGIHIVKRLPLDDGGYALSENADFFSDFEDNLQALKLTEKLDEYEDKIQIDEALLERYDIRSAAANSLY